MAIGNGSKCQKSGPKKAKYKGKSAVPEIFGRYRPKNLIATPESYPSPKSKKERIIQVYSQGNQTQMKIII